MLVAAIKELFVTRSALSKSSAEILSHGGSEGLVLGLRCLISASGVAQGNRADMVVSFKPFDSPVLFCPGNAEIISLVTQIFRRIAGYSGKATSIELL